MQLPSLEWVNQDSAYLRQLRGGFTWLRFADELEPAFRTYHAQVHLQRMRGGLLVAIVMWLLFTVFDLLMLPGERGGALRVVPGAAVQFMGDFPAPLDTAFAVDRRGYRAGRRPGRGWGDLGGPRQ